MGIGLTGIMNVADGHWTVGYLSHRRASTVKTYPHDWPAPDCASLSFKMALLMQLNYHALPLLRREQVFKDRNNPLEIVAYTDEEVFSGFRCHRCELLAIIDEEEKN